MSLMTIALGSLHLGLMFRKAQAPCCRLGNSATDVQITGAAAEEGDVRLVNMERVANWVTGDLQLFFDGAWGQLCSGIFSGRDADVTCRQLGFAAGSQAYPTTGGDMDFRGFPEVVLARSGCNGTEASLLECRANARTDTYDYSFCGSTLRLACVDPEVEGMMLCPLQCEHGCACLVNRRARKSCLGTTHDDGDTATCRSKWPFQPAILLTGVGTSARLR